MRLLPKIKFFVSIAAGLLCSDLFANVGEQGILPIAEEPVSPRISAMGGGGSALSGGGFGIYNPASPAFADAPFVGIEYGSMPGDDEGALTKARIEGAWNFRTWFAGASLSTWSTGFLTANEQGIGQPASWQLMQATVTGGFKIGRFAMGNAINFYQERMADVINNKAFTYSPGFIFRLLPGRLTLGGSLLNYVRLDTVGKKWYTIPATWTGGAIGLPRYVRVGGAWTDTIHHAAIPYTATCDAVYSDVYHHLIVPVGVEAWILPVLAGRIGLPLGHPSDIVHFGVGLRNSFLGFDFDYGISKPVSSGSIEQKWLLGVTCSLPGGKKDDKKVPQQAKAAAAQVQTTADTASQGPKTPTAPAQAAQPASSQTSQPAPVKASQPAPADSAETVPLFGK